MLARGDKGGQSYNEMKRRYLLCSAEMKCHGF